MTDSDDDIELLFNDLTEFIIKKYDTKVPIDINANNSYKYEDIFFEWSKINPLVSPLGGKYSLEINQTFYFTLIICIIKVVCLQKEWTVNATSLKTFYTYLKIKFIRNTNQAKKIPRLLSLIFALVVVIWVYF